MLVIISLETFSLKTQIMEVFLTNLVESVYYQHGVSNSVMVYVIPRSRSFLHLRQASVMGKCGCLFFPRDNSLISRGNSHVSRVRCLVVSCLLFNPEVSCSNPWVCANFFYKYSEAEGSDFFGTMRLFGFVRLFFGFVRLFFAIF